MNVEVYFNTLKCSERCPKAPLKSYEGAEGGNQTLANGLRVNLIQIGRHANWMWICSISGGSSFIKLF